MAFTLKDIKDVLETVPDGATLRVGCAGESFYFAKRGMELTSSADGSFVQVQGNVGSSQESMRPGAVIVRVERVDFLQMNL